MVEINNKANVDIDEKLVFQIVEKFLKIHNLSDHYLSLAFIDDEEIREINKIYRNLDKPTDVLSFPSSEGEKREEKFLGEILIDYDQVKRQVGEYGENEEGEFVFILIHGLLHLLGHTDETEEDKNKMITLGKEIVGKIK